VRVAAALAVVYLVWGSTFAALRIMVETVPPWLGGGARFALAGALMLAWAAGRGGRARLRVTGRQLASCAVVGVLLVTLANGLITAAEVEAPSALAALIAATMPLWVVVLRRAGGEAVPRRALVSVALGLAGVALLLLPGAGGPTPLLPLALVAVAAICWAAGAVAGKRLTMPADLVSAVGAQMLIGGAASLAVGVVAGEPARLRLGDLSPASAVSWAYLVAVGSVLAFSAYAWLLRNASVSLVATHGYVNPLVAAGIGWVVLGEPTGPLALLAAAVIVGSVAVAVTPGGFGRGPAGARLPIPTRPGGRTPWESSRSSSSG
jgi:drug/metabolite transporter (DMT)-like permease